MAQYLIQEETLVEIADAIRSTAQPSPPTILDEYIEDNEYLIEGSVNIYYRIYEDSDNYDGDYGWCPITYEYRENINGEVVPVLFRHEGDYYIHVYEPFYYVGTMYGPDEVLYDAWVKDEYSPEGEPNGEYFQDSQAKCYILTNIIVSAGQSDTGTAGICPTDMPDRIRENAKPYVLNGIYLIKENPLGKNFEYDFNVGSLSDTVDIYMNEIGTDFRMTCTKIESSSDKFRLVNTERQYIEYTDSDGWKYHNLDGTACKKVSLSQKSRLLNFREPHTVPSTELYKILSFMDMDNIPAEMYNDNFDSISQENKTKIMENNGPTKIRDYAFYEDLSLKRVIFPQVSMIGSYAFYGCSNLVDCTLGDSIGSIGNSAFCDCYNLDWSVFMGSIGSIGMSAFNNCRSLTWLNIRTNFINEDAFSGCSNLTTVHLSALGSYFDMGSYAFCGCQKLSKIECYNCSYIGMGAFYSCPELAELRLSGNKIAMIDYDEDSGDSPFAGSTKVYVPANLYNSYLSAWDCWETSRLVAF